jgi:hypothetical protein
MKQVYNPLTGKYNITESNRVEKYIKNIFHVDNYGAIADSDGTTGNGTDNATAINACIDAAVTNGGGIVKFGIGIYRVSSNIIVADDENNVILEGSGRLASILYLDNVLIAMRGDNGGSVNMVYKGNYDETNLISTVWLKGKNVTFKNNEIYNSNSISLNIIQSTLGDGNDKNYIIENNYIHDGIADGIHIHGYCSSALIKGNTIENVGDDAIATGFFTTSDVNDVVICDNIIDKIGARGIGILGFSNGIKVHNNIIKNTWLAGILIECSTGNISNIDITNNKLYNVGGYSPSFWTRGVGVGGGIMAYAKSTGGSNKITNLNILNNSIKNAYNMYIGIGVEAGAGTTNTSAILSAVVSGNICKGLTGKGGLGASSLGTGNNQAFSIGSYPAIYVANTDEVIISEHKITESYQEMIRVYNSVSTYVRITNNTFCRPNLDTGTRYGILVDNVKQSVLNNICFLDGSTLTSMVSLSGTVVGNANNTAG